MDEADGCFCALHDVFEELHAVLEGGMPFGRSGLPEERAVHLGIVDRSDDLQESGFPLINVRHEKERLSRASHYESGAISMFDVGYGDRFEAYKSVQGDSAFKFKRAELNDAMVDHIFPRFISGQEVAHLAANMDL